MLAFAQHVKLVHRKKSGIIKNVALNDVHFLPLMSFSALPQQKIRQLGKELYTLETLLEDFENCVDRQKNHLKQLKVKITFFTIRWTVEKEG